MIATRDPEHGQRTTLSVESNIVDFVLKTKKQHLKVPGYISMSAERHALLRSVSERLLISDGQGW
jgi:hypothetical protein